VKLIILDRDGVINNDALFVKTPHEWKPLPGSLEAIAKLTQAGYKVVVVTNQSGVGRGLLDMTTLNAIHTKMQKAVHDAGGRIDAIFYCPHPEDAKCVCRKPNTGMFEELSERLQTPLKGVPCVGDSIRDLQAAQAMGAQPILVLTGKGERTQKENALPAGTQTFASLSAFVDSMGI
jgi:D-glycero-D-manno-heptose 1,7-bisphosphate phosphatase